MVETMSIVRDNGYVDSETQNLFENSFETAQLSRVAEVSQREAEADRTFIIKNCRKPEVIKSFKPFCRSCYLNDSRLENLSADLNDYRHMAFSERAADREPDRVTSQQILVGHSFIFKCPLRGCSACVPVRFADENSEEQKWLSDAPTKKVN